MNGQDRCAPERGVGGFPEFDLSPNTCAIFWGAKVIHLEGLLGVSWRALGSQFRSRGALCPGSPLGILINLGAGLLSAWTSQRYGE